MTIGDILGVISVLVLVFSSLCSATVLIALTGAQRIDSTLRTAQKYPRRVAGRGAFIAAIALACLVIFHNATAGPEKLLCGVALGLLACFGLTGSAGLATLLSRRFVSPSGSAPSLRHLYQSAVMCLLASVAPVVGWLLVAPLLLITAFGMGSFLLWPIRQSTRKVSDSNDLLEAVS